MTSCRDCAHGRGVYFTEIAPGLYFESKNKEEVKDSGLWFIEKETFEHDGRADSVVMVLVDENLVEEKNLYPNIWKTKNTGNFYLSDADYYSIDSFEKTRLK